MATGNHNQPPNGQKGHKLGPKYQQGSIIGPKKGLKLGLLGLAQIKAQTHEIGPKWPKSRPKLPKISLNRL